METENVEPEDGEDNFSSQRLSMSFHEQSPGVSRKAAYHNRTRSSIMVPQSTIELTQPDEEAKVAYENTMTEVHLRLHRAKPYQKVVETLKQLKEVKQPYSAMKLIRKAKDLIPKCIDEFW